MGMIKVVCKGLNTLPNNCLVSEPTQSVERLGLCSLTLKWSIHRYPAVTPVKLLYSHIDWTVLLGFTIYSSYFQQGIIWSAVEAVVPVKAPKRVVRKDTPTTINLDLLNC